MKNLTLDDIKRLPEVIVKPAENVFKAMTRVEAVREIIKPIKVSILKRHAFKTIRLHERDEEPAVIKDPKNTYGMSDKDFKIYLSEYRKGFEEAGFNNVPKDQCPLLIAESKLRAAKRELIKAAEPVTGLSLKDVLRKAKYYDEYIELLLSLAAKTINTNKKG